MKKHEDFGDHHWAARRDRDCQKKKKKKKKKKKEIVFKVFGIFSEIPQVSTIYSLLSGLLTRYPF